MGLLRALGRVFDCASWTQSSVAAQVSGGHYPSADPRRKLLAELRAARLTADQALVPALETLQAQSAKLDASTPLGRGAVEGFAAELVGSGIDVLPQCADAGHAARIKRRWRRWARHCGTRGQHLTTLQFQAGRSLQRSGGCLWRYVIQASRLDRGWLPLAIMPLPVEWLARDPVQPLPEGQRFLAGVVYDRFGAQVAYDLRDPGDPSAAGERVPAEWCDYIYEERLPGQTIGEPGLAPAIERIWQDGESVVYELRAALVAGVPTVITTAALDSALDTSDPSEAITAIPPGSYVHLEGNEKLEQVRQERPNTKLPEFRGTTRGDVAAMTRVSQRYLDRDNSQVNYSASRDDQLRTRRLTAAILRDFERLTASRPYEKILPYILAAEGIALPPPGPAREDFFEHDLLPDSPEAANALEQVNCDAEKLRIGRISYRRLLAGYGLDAEEIIAERAEDNSRLTTAGLPTVEAATGKAAPAAPAAAAEPEPAPAKKKDI